MKHVLTQSTLFSVAACVLGLLSWGMPSTVNAQASDPAVRTCNLEGSVRITIIGVATTLPVLCVNPTQRYSAGVSEGGVRNFTVGPITLRAMDAISKWVPPGVYEAQTEAAGTGFIETTGLFQGLRCLGSPAAICDVTTDFERLTIGGQEVVFVGSPIPQNFTIQLANVQFPVTLPLGVPVNVALNGQITLNPTEYVTANPDSAFARLEHGSFRLFLSGSIPGVSVELSLKDSSVWTKAGVTSITVNNLGPAAWRQGEL